MKEDYGFCTRCGAAHEPGAEYCLQCGKSFTDEPVPVNTRLNSNPLMLFIILLGIFAAISLGEGLYSSVFNDALISYIKSTYPDNLTEYLAGLGYDTIEHLASDIYKQGVLTLIDGIVVLVAFILCIRRRYWKVAFALCVIGSILVLASFIFMTPEMMKKQLFSVIVQTAIGLLIARGIYVNRKVFR